jgi:2,4-dienoyl-CoA reductase-like NADH-dependent reductase (Old Yellow Enzyme family)
MVVSLLDPLAVREISLRNHIVVSPMCQYSSEDGFASDWHLVHLGSRAVGGASLVFTEAAAVEPRGRISPQDLGIWKDEHLPMLQRITRFIESQGAVAGIQLAHAGRKASTAQPWKGGAPLDVNYGGWRPVVSASAIPFAEGYPAPEALSVDGIQDVTKMFAKAAERALAAGFKVVEIHGAHGYLINQFLSPVSNKRTDAYGGSFENRIRFLRDVVRAIRTVWPERLPLFVRLSITDWLEPQGWDVEQSIALAKVLKDDGVDLIDCSSGGSSPLAEIPVGAGYQVAFAERLRKEAMVMTGAVGMITSAAQADTIVRTGQADLVLMAREFLRHPYFPLHAAKELHAEVRVPPQYGRAF